VKKERKYRLFVICFREKCCQGRRIIKISFHTTERYANDKKARERLWHIACKDFVGFFDRIFCLVLKSKWRIRKFHFPFCFILSAGWEVWSFRFPEKRA